jgi:hypothetical protein
MRVKLCDRCPYKPEDLGMLYCASAQHFCCARCDPRDKIPSYPRRHQWIHRRHLRAFQRETTRDARSAMPPSSSKVHPPRTPPLRCKPLPWHEDHQGFPGERLLMKVAARCFHVAEISASSTIANGMASTFATKSTETSSASKASKRRALRSSSTGFLAFAAENIPRRSLEHWVVQLSGRFLQSRLPAAC